LVARVGRRLLLAGSDVFLPGHPPVEPENSVIQIFELGSPVNIDPSKILMSVTRTEALWLNNPTLKTAVYGDTVVAALPNHLFHITAGLTVKAAYRAEFMPVHLSVDEGGYAYLVVDTPHGRDLWVVSPDGRREVEVPLPVEHRTLVMPPVAGYDHRIYLLTAALAVAFSPDGKRIRETVVPGGVTGAGVTIDGSLLVTAGNQVTAIHPDGEKVILYRAAGERITTPPVLTAHNEILFGAGRVVHCLTRHP
jgi:hypothetical protein